MAGRRIGPRRDHSETRRAGVQGGGRAGRAGRGAS